MIDSIVVVVHVRLSGGGVNIETIDARALPPIVLRHFEKSISRVGAACTVLMSYAGQTLS